MAINTKTYISKSNTIVKGNPSNLGLNPIMELNYGKMISRGMIYFDHTKVKKMVEDKIYPDMSKLKHILRMTNAASANDRNINCPVTDSEGNDYKQRAVSFDLIFFLIPYDWDSGRGFDYSYDLYGKGNRGISTDGSNWYKYANYFKWDEEGIYSTSRLSKEVDKFTSFKGNLSNIIIGNQHFDIGNEPIEFDITNVFNKFINGELCNYGIGIAFSPKFEEAATNMSQYVGFFTEHTNSFYEPYVETTYNDTIEDNRSDFYLDKDNRLYFYASVGGNSVNLDELPKCTVNGKEYEVKQSTKGIYYIDINLPSSEYEVDTMYYDIWSNIKYKGKTISDKELDFVTKSGENYFSFGLPDASPSTEKFIPYLYGISNSEKIRRGDIRKINIECKIPYTSDQLYSVDDIEYRLYTMQGEREIDVISYSKCEKVYNGNYFLINTNDLIPSRYYVDIKIKYDMEQLLHRKVLEFDIVGDAKEYFT